METIYYSSNNGVVDGNVTFQYGNNNGTINGNADFTSGGSYAANNYGTVNGDATFYSNDDYYGWYNYGTVTGTIYVYVPAAVAVKLYVPFALTVIVAPVICAG